MWRKIIDVAKISFFATKWYLETVLFTVFWLIILPSYMYFDYFLEGEMTDIVREIILMCIRPSINNLTKRLTMIMLLNLAFNLTVRSGKFSVHFYHLISFITGCLVLYTNSYPRNLVLISGFLLIGWLLLRRIKHNIMHYSDMIRPVYTVSFVLFLILVGGEVYFPDYRNWRESRGILMIMTMKIISLSTEDYYLINITSQEFFGYLLCPGTVLFGPWIKIQEYRKYYSTHAKLNWKWLVKIIQIFTYAMICMIVSNCLSYVLVVPDFSVPCKWHEAFRNALAFRVSNYFVCYMAELTMIVAGFNYIHGNPSQDWQYTICNPLSVEFPRSIANVVRNWNIPIHRFLKHYVYIPFVDVGKTYAIVITFFVSALLHGLNIRITIVLISLGILSLSQQVLQDKVANRLNSCCRITACRPNCNHRFGFYHPISLAINGVNMLLNMIHLAYLGYVMDDKFQSSTLSDLYHMWDEEFALISHHLIILWFGTLLFVA